MAGYWPSFSFCVFMDLDFVSIHKNAKRELGQYPAILTSRLVNNIYILGAGKIKDLKSVSGVLDGAKCEWFSVMSDDIDEI